MRKVILFNLITLDGYFAGPAGEIDWHQVDAEFNDFAIQQLNQAGGLIFGRITYQMMAGYWPSQQANQDDPEVAGKMTSLQKHVFSHSLDSVEWENTRLIRGDACEELRSLKQQPGGDLFIFGSANLSATFIQNHLVDEFRVMVNPIILGSGQSLFPRLNQLLHLRLLETRTFRNGNVLLYYQPSSSS